MFEHTSPRSFSFASELRAAPDERASTPAKLLEGLDHFLVDLGTGEIHGEPLGGSALEVIGFCRLASAEELAEVFPGATFLEPLPPCPFRGEHLAWLLWDIPVPRGEPELFGMDLAGLSLGRGIDLRDGRFFDALVECEFLLSEVTNKWGFGDGELLAGSDAYESYVHRCLQEALQKVGVEERLTRPSNFGTLHNAYRLLDADARTKAQLEGHTVRLWARNPQFPGPRNGGFFES